MLVNDNCNYLLIRVLYCTELIIQFQHLSLENFFTSLLFHKFQYGKPATLYKMYANSLLCVFESILQVVIGIKFDRPMLQIDIKEMTLYEIMASMIKKPKHDWN